MCAGPFKSKSQPVIRDTAAEAQQTQQAEMATDKAKSQRSERLQENVTRMRGGRGRRSLITSSRGGMGFYNEYMN
jgi:hypothetical protein